MTVLPFERLQSQSRSTVWQPVHASDENRQAQTDNWINLRRLPTA
jgi:hypothetical protein